MASLLGKIPTESVRRRISLLRRSWGLLDQICLHTSTGKAAVGQQVGSCGLEVEGSCGRSPGGGRTEPRRLLRRAGRRRQWSMALTAGHRLLGTTVIRLAA